MIRACGAVWEAEPRGLAANALAELIGETIVFPLPIGYISIADRLYPMGWDRTPAHPTQDRARHEGVVDGRARKHWRVHGRCVARGRSRGAGLRSRLPASAQGGLGARPARAA